MSWPNKVNIEPVINIEDNTGFLNIENMTGKTVLIQVDNNDTYLLNNSILTLKVKLNELGYIKQTIKIS